MTTPNEDPNTSVPQDKAVDSDASGRSQPVDPATSVPQDKEPNTSVPQDNA